MTSKERKLKQLDNATFILTIFFWVLAGSFVIMKYPMIYSVVDVTIGVSIRSMYWYARKKVKNDA